MSPTPVHSHGLTNRSFFLGIDVRVWFSSAQPHFRPSSCSSPDCHSPSRSTALPHTLPKLLRSKVMASLLTTSRRPPPPRHRSPWS
ncbi:uncharacterized protein DS421_20g704700 [Arachis hypogaea]|nr:uncharacterized protein DS421_20g704700 [Arachis hypogaea]